MEQLITVVLFGGMWWWASRTMIIQKHEIIVLHERIEDYEWNEKRWAAQSAYKDEEVIEEDRGLQ